MATDATQVRPAALVGPPVADREHRLLDRLPGRLRDYAVLARWDRPIGTWLLLLPCWWGLALAPGRFDPMLALLFFIGAWAMRGAGCTVNDIVDRRFDAMVARTRNRPIAAGRIGLVAAFAFVLQQCLVGLVVLLQFGWPAILIGFASLPLIVIYPFAKRFTWWPQAFLGLAFNWGVLVGYAAVTGTLRAQTLVLYIAGIAWTLGYDTIYAHQDKQDDALIGVRSTARLFGRSSKAWLALFYGLAVLLVGLAGLLAGKGPLFWLLLPVAAFSLARQIAVLDIDDPAACLAQFRANRWSGLAVTAALTLGGL